MLQFGRKGGKTVSEGGGTVNTGRIWSSIKWGVNGKEQEFPTRGYKVQRSHPCLGGFDKEEKKTAGNLELRGQRKSPPKRKEKGKKRRDSFAGKERKSARMLDRPLHSS